MTDTTNPITLDQLRAYLERREREASANVDRTLNACLTAGSSRREQNHRRDVYTIASARWNLYRELLDAIETGELPGE